MRRLASFIVAHEIKAFMYIHERDNWTNFRWDASEVSKIQERGCVKIGAAPFFNLL